MALALNVFKTITKIATTNSVGIYTAPVGYSGVVLLAQAANIGNSTQSVSLSHKRSNVGIAVTTEIVRNLPVSTDDSVTLLSGKLILESGDALVLSGSNSTDIKFIASILETLN
jgi:hypothetical protein